MTSRSLVLAAVAFFITGAALAQATDDSLRASGGQIELLGKTTDRWSGSFGISASRSQLPFTAGMARGYNGSLGGTLIPDRLWFFASAERVQPLFTQTPYTNVPVIRGFEVNAAGQLGLQQNFSARIDPSTFMTMHYTGMVSPNSFFTATISR